MSAWKLEYSPKFKRELGKLDSAVSGRILAGLERLLREINDPDAPRQSDLTKMEGTANDWRLRVGTFRIIFRRDGDRLVILVLHVGNRRDVYKG